MELQKITEQACELVLQTGSFIKQEALKVAEIAIEEKDRNSLVSYVDKTAEKILVEGLGKLIPGCGFITEEDTVDINDREWTWIIDPLDGTTNFLWSLPVYSVSVGLQRGDKLVAGMVFEINRDELFYAHEGGKAYLNNKTISVSKRSPLSKALIATGFPYTDYSGIEGYISALRKLMEQCRGMRRMGSAAVDLAYVACGRFDGFFEYGLNSWDVAGGAVIIQQAGGKVTGFTGEDNYLFSREMVATNGAIHDEFQNLLLKEFGV